MANEGYIKLYRKMTKWGWYTDGNTLRVFLHLLLLASYDPCWFKGVHLKAGQTVTSIRKISLESGLSVRSVRTSIEHLKSTQEVTQELIGKNSVFTVVNYEQYQGIDTIADNSPTQKRHSTDTDTDIKKLRSEEIKKSTIAQNEEFDRFWSAYPKKKSKGDALKAFEKIKPDGETMERILSAISKQKNSDQWKEENGKYIPYPATWLNRMNWEDEEADPCRIVHLPVKVPKTKEELKEALYE